MERNIRYVLLENEDDQPAQPVGASAIVSVVSEVEEEPVEEATPETQVTEETEVPPDLNMPCPPSYSIATNLPSYEEAERSKQEEEARRQREEEAAEADATHSSPQNNVFSRMLGWQSRVQRSSETDTQLGTDGMFLCTFLMAFVFNWVGLLASMCVTQTIAGRLGAMSGFGLSLVKWVAIFKHSYGSGITAGDSWLWWLFMVMGFLIFFRGCTQYIRIKYYWQKLNQNVRNNIFYYF